MSICLFVCLSDCLNSLGTKVDVSLTPKIRGPVPQVLKQAVNLSYLTCGTSRRHM